MNPSAFVAWANCKHQYLLDTSRSISISSSFEFPTAILSPVEVLELYRNHFTILLFKPAECSDGPREILRAVGERNLFLLSKIISQSDHRGGIAFNLYQYWSMVNALHGQDCSAEINVMNWSVKQALHAALDIPERQESVLAR